jgi:hypothetical protein
LLKFSYIILKNVNAIYYSSKEIRVNNIDTIMLTTVLSFPAISFSKIAVGTLLKVGRFEFWMVTSYSSSNINNSSIVVCSAFETSWANLREGLYFPFSMNNIVSRLTPTFLARSSWVKSYRALSSLIRVLISFTCPVVVKYREKAHHQASSEKKYKCRSE